MDHDQPSGISRRAVLGGLGLTAGAGVIGVGLGGGVAGATTDRLQTDSSGLAVPQSVTALQPALRYIVFCGHDFSPLVSPTAYTTIDGQFHFNPTSSGYASVRLGLPVGSVIKELELYGTRGASGVITLDLWKSGVSAGSVTRTAQTVVPAVAGPFTATLACNDVQDEQFKSVPFVHIDATAAPDTFIFGLRVGYVSATGFVPLSTAVNPRVYNTRDSGLPKLGPAEERTIALPVPAAVGAAVFTLTITETEGPGGFVSVFPAGIQWPGNSSINWSAPNQNIANTVVSAVSPNSEIVIHGGANPTHVIIDVAGWIA